MINKFIHFLFLIIITIYFAHPGFTQDINEKMKNIINDKVPIIEKLSEHPILTNAIIAQNEKNVSLTFIKKIDEDWKAGRIQNFVMSLQNNAVGIFLRKKIKSNRKIYSEAFLCDIQGAIVGEYPITSDYWQGDEYKFIEPMKTGKVYIGPSKFDQSTQCFSVQISAPIMHKGKAIGVLVVGLRNILKNTIKNQNEK